MTDKGRPRSLRDRLIAGISRLLAACFFRSVETVGSVPPSGPVIVAASHLNGFVDPVLLVSRVGLLPRFLAKATLWKTVPARPFLRFARIIPVHRRADAAGGEVDNRGTFDDAIAALADGHLLAVFPEGTTHDDPSIRPLRTGVARIALQAVASGLDHVDIVPTGVSYQDKVAVRDRAVIAFGPPITVRADDAPADLDSDDAHQAVRDLTARLDQALRDVTPDFSSLEESLALNAAARITVDADGPARGATQARELELAKQLARRDRATVDGLVSVVARYSLLLGSVQLTDDDLIRPVGVRWWTRRIVGLALLIVVLAPFAAAGLVANAIPALAVLMAGLVPKAPVSKGTVRLLVAMLAFPLTWIAIAAFDVGEGWVPEVARAATAPIQPILQALFHSEGGLGPGLLAIVALPLFGAAALVLVDRCWTFVHDVLVWRTLVDRRGQLPAIRAARDDVVAATRAAAGTR